jgi:monoamine oxidase
MEPNDIRWQLERIAQTDAGRPRKNITLIGAGIAGLVAAYEFTNLGHCVRIYEGSGRIGGRIRTHRFGTGASDYHELGAMRFPVEHRYTRHYIGQMGLTKRLRRFVSSHDNLDCFYDFVPLRLRRSNPIRIRQAPTAVFPVFELSPKQRSDPATPRMLHRALASIVDTLTEPEMLSLLGSPARPSPPPLSSDRLRELDRLTLGEFLRQRMGEQATQLVGVTIGLESLYDRALTVFLRDALRAEDGPLSTIDGGMDQLPEALGARHIAIHLNRRVKRLSVSGDDPLIVFGGHEPGEPDQTESAAIVLCTLPFAVLRQIDIEPALPAKLMRAIKSMSYVSAAKVLLRFDQRWWEMNDGIYGGASHTDDITRQIYYPSDNIVDEGYPEEMIQADDRAGERREGLRTQSETRRAVRLGRKLSYTTDFERATRLLARSNGQLRAADAERTSGPGVLLACYCLGQDARRIGTLSDVEREETTLRVLQRIHGNVRHSGFESIFWDQEEFAAGAFAFLLPGEQDTLYADAVTPIAHPPYDRKLFFAGEHCSLTQGWIQGAIQSSLNAVEDIVSL